MEASVKQPGTVQQEEPKKTSEPGTGKPEPAVETQPKSEPALEAASAAEVEAPAAESAVEMAVKEAPESPELAEAAEAGESPAKQEAEHPSEEAAAPGESAEKPESSETAEKEKTEAAPEKPSEAEPQSDPEKQPEKEAEQTREDAPESAASEELDEELEQEDKKKIFTEFEDEEGEEGLEPEDDRPETPPEEPANDDSEEAAQTGEPEASSAEGEETPTEETAEVASEPKTITDEDSASTEEAPTKSDESHEGKETAPEEDAEEPEEELSEEDEKRLSDMTRTVQLSVEQIMARVTEEESEPEGDESQDDSPSPEDGEPEEDGPLTIQDHVRSGLSGMAKWMLLVLFVVLVIAGFGVAWLYRSATPDMLPQITVKFAGQELEPTAYKWKVPVIGNVFKRTYADTLSSTPVTLTETVEQASPDFVVSPSDYRTELTVTDAADNVIFEGDTDTFSAFQFTANGTYTAKLVVHSDASSVPGDTSVTGSETWQFNFTVGVRPSITLSGTTVTQGSVAAVRVGDTLDGQAPTIETELQNAGFFKASSGWVCYLPIPWNQAAGTQTIVVNAGGYTETLELKIKAASWEYKDYSTNSQRVSPYIGQNDIPTELQKLLTQSETTIGWSNSNFVQPFLNTLDVKLAFGTTEYVGRSYSERSSNTGAGGRTVTNVVLDTTSGELLIAPASGKVLLAKDLGGDFGYTLVIDHGAGVKSIFYNLQKITVKAGDAVKQGQTLASCGKTTVAEMRIGTVPVDPLQIWRGQCDALKYY